VKVSTRTGLGSTWYAYILTSWVKNAELVGFREDVENSLNCLLDSQYWLICD
jgi:hypothetical protein